jgi:hypothetical protein
MPEMTATPQEDYRMTMKLIHSAEMYFRRWKQLSNRSHVPSIKEAFEKLRYEVRQLAQYQKLDTSY